MSYTKNIGLEEKDERLSSHHSKLTRGQAHKHFDYEINLKLSKQTRKKDDKERKQQLCSEIHCSSIFFFGGRDKISDNKEVCTQLGRKREKIW